MVEQLTPEQLNQAQRWFAVECNNRAWGLAAQVERTPAEAQEMLYAAYAAAFHWSKIGQPINDARAEVALAHVHALLGHGQLAQQYARRCLAFFEHNDGEDWDIAFAHAEMAHAAAVTGERELHAHHYAAAQARGAAIEDEEDRRIFLDELARIPSQILSHEV
ncbi:MAG: hypothetical protein U0401_10050 [Anaerolineae bacterium]